MARKTSYVLPDAAEDLRISDRIMACPVCKAKRTRVGSGWLCAQGMDHTGIMSDHRFAELLREQLPSPRGECGDDRTRRISRLVDEAKAEAAGQAKGGRK